MKKYMLLAKNDFNEEIFYTDIKAEAKQVFDRMLDKYIFVKAFCLGANDIYKDITDVNTQTKYRVMRYTGVKIESVFSDEVEAQYINEEWQNFTNEIEAMLYIINSIKAGFKCKLYKGEKRDWRV